MARVGARAAAARAVAMAVAKAVADLEAVERGEAARAEAREAGAKAAGIFVYYNHSVFGLLRPDRIRHHLTH